MVCIGKEEYMEFSVKDIGVISKAAIDIKGITVIAGLNNTGKSTVGRALFSVFNSLYDKEEKIREEKVRSISDLITNIHFGLTEQRFMYNRREIAEKIIQQSDRLKDDAKLIIDLLEKYDEALTQIEDKSEYDRYVSRIQEVLKISDEEIFNTIMEKRIQAEFTGQINNVYSDRTGEIELKIKNEKVLVRIKSDKVVGIAGNIRLNTEIVYLDDPFVLDEGGKNPWRTMTYPNHRSYLKDKIFDFRKSGSIVDEIVTNKKLENIIQIMSAVCDGSLERCGKFDRKIGYRQKGSDKAIALSNLSSGLKIFIALKELLLNGTIQYNGTIILDEPEIHLHPEWQLLFAEIIVLLQKEFNMHILMTTHSPYFLRAIQVYSAKYGIADGCRYYLSESRDKAVHFVDVSGKVDKIYQTLAQPLQELENERYQND